MPLWLLQHMTGMACLGTTSAVTHPSIPAFPDIPKPFLRHWPSQTEYPEHNAAASMAFNSAACVRRPSLYTVNGSRARSMIGASPSAACAAGVNTTAKVNPSFRGIDGQLGQRVERDNRCRNRPFPITIHPALYSGCSRNCTESLT